jgi:hypothetical protein
VDTTAPALTISGGSTAVTGDTTPTITGTSDAVGRTVTVTVAGQTRTAVVSAGGVWTVTAGTLTDGDHTVTATVTDTVGNASTETQILTVDLTNPTLAINGGANALTGDTTPTIAGTSDAIGRTVTVTVAGQTLTAVVTADGVWSVTTRALTAGNTTVTAEVSDVVGNSSTANQTLTVDLTAPTITITGGVSKTTGDTTPTISGTSNAIGRTVTVTASGQTLTSTVSGGGTWTVTAAVLVEGGHTVTATVTNAVSKTVTATQTLTVDLTAPELTINGGLTATTHDITPTISGTSDAIGRTVTVTISGQTLTAVVAEDGTWDATAATLTSGDHPVTATVTDTAGNSASANQTLIIDLTAPTLTIDGGASANTRNNTPTITGTSDAIGRTVTVTVAGQTLTATVTAGSTWSVTIEQLPEGPNTVTASVTNTFAITVTATQTLTVDATAPILTIDGGVATSTPDDTPTITGTSDAYGQTVTVAVAGQTLTAVVAGDGTWTVTAATLTSGNHPVTATVSDTVGNTTTATQTVTVDADAPTLTIDGGSAATTSDVTPTLTGTSDAVGQALTVTVGGQKLTPEITADGRWSVVADTLSYDTHTVTATVSDAIGNRTTATQTLTVTAFVPTVTIDGGGTATTEDDTPTIAGTANTDIVTVTIGEQTLTSAVSNGIWSVTSGTLTIGNHTVVATATDSTGSTATATQTLTHRAPTIVNVLHNTTRAQTIHQGSQEAITVSGYGFQPGEQIEIWLNSTPTLLGTITANPSGDVNGKVYDKADTPLGPHHIVLNGPESGTSAESETITVIAAGTPIAETGGGSGTDTGSGGDSSGGGETSPIIIILWILLILFTLTTAIIAVSGTKWEWLKWPFMIIMAILIAIGTYITHRNTPESRQRRLNRAYRKRGMKPPVLATHDEEPEEETPEQAMHRLMLADPLDGHRGSQG